MNPSRYVDRRARPAQPGFTLIELMIVVIIVGVLALIAVPRFGGAQNTERLKGAMRRIDADLRLARGRALDRGASYTLSFNTATRSYSLAPGVPGALGAADFSVDLASDPYGLSMLALKGFASSSVVFDGYGMLQVEGGFTLGIGDLRLTFDVTRDGPVAGTATWSRE